MSWMDTFSNLTGFDFSGSSEKISKSPDPMIPQVRTIIPKSTEVRNTPVNTSGDYNQAISQINKHILGIWERENLYPQKLGSGSERSDSDIWKHLDVHVWGKEYVDQHTGQITAGNPSAIVPQFQSDIAGVQQEGQTQRDRIEAKVDEGIAEHQIFYDLHTEQEGRISDKASKGHTHNGNNGLDWYIKLALVAAGAFLVYFIIRRKFLK